MHVIAHTYEVKDGFSLLDQCYCQALHLQANKADDRVGWGEFEVVVI